MAGQGPSRRQLLEALGCASLAAAAPGFSRWAYAFAEPEMQHDRMSAPSHAARTAVYRPRFFSPAEYGCVVMLAELILPGKEGGPVRPGGTARAKVRPVDAGATDAGVAEFIDFMAAEDLKVRAGFKSGLRWLDKAAAPTGFAGLRRPKQIEMLERLAYRKNFLPEEAEGQRFFALLRRYTVMGFYTSRIGLESLDYPGLRFYAESPAVPQDGSLARVLAAGTRS